MGKRSQRQKNHHSFRGKTLLHHDMSCHDNHCLFVLDLRCVLESLKAVWLYLSSLFPSVNLPGLRGPP